MIKGGNIVCAQMGDPNASIPTPQPVYMRPMFGSLGRAASSSSVAFISRRCMDSGVGSGYNLGKSLNDSFKFISCLFYDYLVFTSHLFLICG